MPFLLLRPKSAPMYPRPDEPSVCPNIQSCPFKVRDVRMYLPKLASATAYRDTTQTLYLYGAVAATDSGNSTAVVATPATYVTGQELPKAPLASVADVGGVVPWELPPIVAFVAPSLDCHVGDCPAVKVEASYQTTRPAWYCDASVTLASPPAHAHSSATSSARSSALGPREAAASARSAARATMSLRSRSPCAAGVSAATAGQDQPSDKRGGARRADLSRAPTRRHARCRATCAATTREPRCAAGDPRCAGPAGARQRRVLRSADASPRNGPADF